MSDTERLNLIEHYEWDLIHYANGWMIAGKFGSTKRFKSIRECIEAALATQAKWAFEIY